MDDNAKNTSSYQLDQEILDARGISMTVEEVAGLSTCKYSERVQSLKLNEEDLAFLKGLRRRIKNRLASQNSRRRSVEHLRRLARELRAVRACRDDALAERRALITQRDSVRDRCIRLRRYIVQILQDRSDNTDIPSIDVEVTHLESPKPKPKIITVTETKTPLLPECFENSNSYESTERNYDKSENICDSTESNYVKSQKIFDSPERCLEKTLKNFDSAQRSSEKTVKNFDSAQRSSEKTLKNFDSAERCLDKSEKVFDSAQRNFEKSEKIFDSAERCLEKSEILYENSPKNIFECRIDKLVQQSVNHLFKSEDNKKVFAKTVFISNDKLSSEIKSMVLCESEMKLLESDNGVLNLSLKEGRRKSHGRKQLAPRRIAYVYADSNDGVLDLKVKKEPQ